MCGLIGALLAESDLTRVRIAATLASIGHRGPDHTRWWRSSDRRMMLGRIPTTPAASPSP
jgi:asparagine synthetase B (glutamine-hydrolysing)